MNFNQPTDPSQNPYTTFLWQLTVAEYIDLQKKLTREKKYEYGIKGLAKVLGCSRSKAYEIKASGALDSAISQRNRLIIIDVDKALELFKNTNL